jgi:ATP-dependent RNA helicase DDX24/MAK5
MHAAPRVSLATIVGGMSSQKQLRMLERGADIIVATPGRFWELVSGVSAGEESHRIRLLTLVSER